MTTSNRSEYRARVAALPSGGAQATRRALARVEDARAIVLVEGFSDQLAVETLARQRGRNLRTERVAVVPIGGAQAAPRSRDDMERLGFFVCDADLEDELIRALGPDAVEGVLAGEGDLDAFRTFQRQPAWRGRSVDQQLHRFMGSAGRRKLRYARLLVEALDPQDVPRPLMGALDHILR